MRPRREPAVAQAERVAVVQLGARRHYAVPRILHEAGRLERLYTDACAVKGLPRLLRAVPPSLRSSGLRRLLGRVPEGVPRDRITAFTRFGLEYVRRAQAARTAGELTAAHLWADARVSQLVQKRGFGDATAAYAFHINGAILGPARARGLRTIVDQALAPRELMRAILREEHDRFPDWETPIAEDEHLAEHVEREHEQWENADVILCVSDFVRDAVVERTGRPERCHLVPSGVGSEFVLPERTRRPGPLRVLTVGHVCLRKGSQYVFEAARRLEGAARFRLVGGVRLDPHVVPDLQHVDLRGAVPRSEMPDEYAWADVFLLPSLFEGSALASYEALASGLPTIVTPNTGTVVRDGIDGYVVPIRDADAIVDRIERLASDPQLRHEMASHARARAREYDLAGYGTRLLGAIGGPMEAPLT